MEIDSALLIAGLAFILVFTLYMAVDATFSRKEKLQQLEEKIAAGAGGVAEDDMVGLDEEKSGSAKFCEGLLRGIGVDVDKKIDEVRPELLPAGMTSMNAPIYLLFMNYIGRWVLIALGGMFVFAGLQGSDETLNYSVGLFLLFIGILGPKMYVTNKKQHRQRTLIRSFPDTLDLLVVCVESGLALDAALGRVCQELGRAHPEITKELNRTRLELALLNDRSTALQNLAERTDLVPFRSLVAALIQTEKFGTSLTDTLRVLSEDYRQARLSAAEAKAGRLPVIMTIPLILLLMPALLIVILGPPFVRVQQQGGLFGESSQSAQPSQSQSDN